MMETRTVVKLVLWKAAPMADMTVEQMADPMVDATAAMKAALKAAKKVAR